jgi:hypothetical protein
MVAVLNVPKVSLTNLAEQIQPFDMLRTSLRDGV